MIMEEETEKFGTLCYFDTINGQSQDQNGGRLMEEDQIENIGDQIDWRRLEIRLRRLEIKMTGDQN